jgi:lipoprotein-releasing system permease protein
VPGVKVVTEVIEDYAYLKYRDANQVVMMKGVSPNFIEQHRIDNNIVEGDLQNNFNYAIIGRGIQYTLSISLDDINSLHIYYIKNIKRGSLNPSDLYSQKAIRPGAVFSIVQNFDENYVIVPLDFAADLLNYKSKRTSLEVQTDSNAEEQAVINKLEYMLGENFNVLNHEQQHKDLFKLLKTEKLFAFLALTLLLIVGSINIFFSLMMLALEKKKDVSILHAMGTQLPTIRYIFLLQGGLIAIIGTVSGLLIGWVIVWVQQSYGLVSMGMETAVMEGYPVKMVASDFINVLVVMILITFLISYKPASLAAKFASVQHL